MISADIGVNCILAIVNGINVYYEIRGQDKPLLLRRAMGK